MTKQEFTNRTLVEVSDEEFNAIQTVYYASDLGKNEFCKLWCKMNPSRVQDAKIERKWKIREECYKDALHKFYTKTANYSDIFATPICYVKISAYEVRALAYANIDVATKDGHCKYLSDIRYEIGQYLGIC